MGEFSAISKIGYYDQKAQEKEHGCLTVDHVLHLQQYYDGKPDYERDDECDFSSSYLSSSPKMKSSDSFYQLNITM